MSDSMASVYCICETCNANRQAIWEEQRLALKLTPEAIARLLAEA